MNIKLLRLALHMNTAQAARYLAARPDHPDGVSETTWVRWENGKREVPADLQQHLQSVCERLLSEIKRIDEIAQNSPNCEIGYYADAPNDDVLSYHIQLAGAVYAHTIKLPTVAVDKQPLTY